MLLHLLHLLLDLSIELVLKAQALHVVHVAVAVEEVPLQGCPGALRTRTHTQHETGFNSTQLLLDTILQTHSYSWKDTILHCATITVTMEQPLLPTFLDKLCTQHLITWNGFYTLKYSVDISVTGSRVVLVWMYMCQPVQQDGKYSWGVLLIIGCYTLHK